ncbi:MAG: bifunctional nuclease family protein [Verrucomicrobia bacterium]|nr:bifunctional nuclease family protein [Verrucomicrobiota bacterium]
MADQEVHTVTFNKILQARNYTAFVLTAPTKAFAIYASPHIGEVIQKHLASQTSPRPQTHDVLSHLLKAVNVNFLHLTITDVAEAVFYCRLFLEQVGKEKQEIIEIDIRPSDGLTLALMHHIPIYCTQQALDKASPYQDP